MPPNPPLATQPQPTLNNRRKAYLRELFGLKLSDVKDRARLHNVTKDAYYDILDELTLKTKLTKKKETRRNANIRRQLKQGNIKISKKLTEHVEDQPMRRSEDITLSNSNKFRNTAFEFTFTNNAEH